MRLISLSCETRLACTEAALVAAAAPALVFPGPSSAVAAFLLAAALFARYQRTGRFWTISPLDAPVFLLALAVFVGVTVSAVPVLSAPKAWGLLLGIAAYGTVTNLPRTVAAAEAVLWLLVAVLLAVTVLALVGADWSAAPIVQAPWLYDRLPRLLRGVPGSGIPAPSDLFSPREIGGTLALLLPIVAIATPRRKGLTVPLIVLLTVSATVLLLTQTPTAIAGVVAAALLALAVEDRSRRRLWTALIVIGGITAAAALGWLLAGSGAAFSSESLAGQQRAGFGLVSRLEIWQRALAMVADMPYTGIGLNTFPLVMDRFYSGVVLGPEPHAHNLLLQVAVDLGLPGLVAFTGLLAGAALMLALTVRASREPDVRRMALGIGAGLLAFCTFGAIDTISPGAKPGLALWLTVGMAPLLLHLTPHAAFPARRFFGALLAALAVAQLLPLATAGPVRNIAHMLAHRAMLGSAEPDMPGLRVALPWLTESAQAVDDGWTWRLTAEAQAYLGTPEGATALLRQGLAADLRTGIGAYTPGEALAQGTPEAIAARAVALTRVYRAWQVRYPDRAGPFLAGAVAWCEAVGNRDAALASIDAGSEAQPQAWLEHYRAAELARETACAPPVVQP